MRKKIVIIVLIISLILAACSRVDYNQLKIDFDNLLRIGSYESAHALYETAEDERLEYYQQSLNNYAIVLIGNAKNNMPFEEAKASLNDFLIFEYTSPAVQEALDFVIATEQALIQSNTNYLEGTDSFLSRDFDTAYEKLSAVRVFDANYQNAQDMLAQLGERNTMWETAAANNLSGRNTSVNSLAYKDGYVYFPTDTDNIHSIVKYNYPADEASVFPLVEFPGTFHIKGINVIGNYIYFIAGEDLGRGLAMESPYNIYEMKTDGTELTMVKLGDYFDLISYGDTFYALSYSKGLVKMDKNFNSEEVISDKWIIEMQATDAGLYYTEKLKNTYDSPHILYLYKDGQSTEIIQKEMLHVYFFDTYSLYYHDVVGKNIREELYIADLNVENSERLAILSGGSTGDMYNFIGALGDKVMLNTAGWLRTTATSASMRQRKYSELEISKKKVTCFQSAEKAPEYEVTNVLYEEKVGLALSTDGTYSFSSSPGENLLERVVNIPEYDPNSLAANMSIIVENSPGDDDFYTEEEVVIELDDFWYYSSPNLNVSIERIYDESVETLIFVAHVRQKDLSGFNIGYGNLEPPGTYVKGAKTDDIAQINNAVFATNGDFAMFGSNHWSGKVIREGRIFDGIENYIKEYDPVKLHDTSVDCDDYLVMYPDGTMTAYTDRDKITYGQLLDAGVTDMLSFGPILVRDDQKSAASTNPGYYISGANPRCAWGMVEPGHYVSIVCDGRQPDVSRGMSFYTLADYFQRLGCSVAYNLDGGQTAAITFMGRFINTHKNDGGRWVNHRTLREIVYFGTSDLVPMDLENYYEE